MKTSDERQLDRERSNEDAGQTAGVRRRVRRLAFVGLAAVVLAAALFIFWPRSESDIALNIPDPEMPNPNAYDIYKEAGDLLNEELERRMTAREAVDLSAGQRQGPLSLEEAFAGKKGWTGDPVSSEEKAELVKALKPVLQRLREGMQYEYRQTPTSSFMRLFPELAQFREIARLLVVEGRLKAESGDWTGAVDSYLDAVDFGSDIANGGEILGLAVGTGAQYRGRYEVWDAIPHLSAAEARHAARRVEGVIERQKPFHETLVEEKWGTLASWLELMSNPDWPLSIYDDLYLPSPEEDYGFFGKVRHRYRIRTTSKRRVLEGYEEYADAWILRVQGPYPPVGPGPGLPDDIFNEFVLDLLEGAAYTNWLRHLLASTQDSLLACAFALHAYKLDRGAYPDSLSKLAPEYLKSVPSDAFANGKSLMYILASDGYILYSLGPDADDDEGRSIEDIGEPESRIRFHVRPQSKGDIVAGINKD